MSYTDFIFLFIYQTYFTSSNLNTAVYQCIINMRERFGNLLKAVKANKNAERNSTRMPNNAKKGYLNTPFCVLYSYYLTRIL